MLSKKWVTLIISIVVIAAGMGIMLQFSKKSVDSLPAKKERILPKPVKSLLNAEEPKMENSREVDNRLINEKSPYLLKHAKNPVDWYPWGDEAFEKALKEDKPIFLSIGYSTCHWCNVMERESYDDPETAKLMNDAFVSIKVDREERPDIDNVYISICQMMSRNGCGWPLNIIMTPDKKPFFAATYIPKNARFGRSGLMELIPRVKEAWQSRREDILTAANTVTDALKSFSGNTQEVELDKSVINNAYMKLSGRFDEEYGGFGQSPKFPGPHTFMLLLRYWNRTGDKRALLMAEKSLKEISDGGIHDHIGFGFHRYSTDREWLVPHFEKMLYDQALLAIAYTELYQATGKVGYAKTAKNIFTYILRDMTSPEGVFYSAEDADSEGEEGKFYLWTKDEVEKILEKDEAGLIVNVFNLQEGGNYIDQLEGKKTGVNIFHLKGSLGEISSKNNISEKDLERRIEKARKKLFAVREKRIHPYKDDKILTDWNGLVIAALSKEAQAFDEPEYLEAAERAADFILKKMRLSNGRLLHRYRNGEAAIPAMVNDYAYFTWGLLELYEASFQVSYLETAIELTKTLIKHFWDKKDGGFFFSSDDSEKILVPWKDFSDGALPSGNSVSMLNLLRLGRITAIAEFEDKAYRIGRLAAAQASQVPAGFTLFLTALDFRLGPSYEVVISGKPDSEDTKKMIKAIRTRFIPNKVVIFRPDDKKIPDITMVAKFTENQTSLDGKSTAYVCLNYSCNLPTTDINEMLGLLSVRDAV